MRKPFLLLWVILAAALLCSCSSSGSSSAGTYSVTVSPIQTSWPIAREASGQWEIVGEAQFYNDGTETVTIATVDLVVYDAQDTVLADRTYGTTSFADMIMIALRSPDGAYTRISSSTNRLAPTDRGFCHVAALAGSSSLPVRASVTIAFSNGKSETADVPLYEFDPGQQTAWPTRFDNGDWVSINTAEAYHHWRDINIQGSTVGDSERFALDIMRVDAQYHLSNPVDSTNKQEYYSWGEDILSAGSGTVAAVISDRPDQEIGSADQNQPAGNYIVIQYGRNLFALYAHMMNGSAAVGVGDAVVAGQVIGKIGNSGNSTAPHLHFQYMDAADMTTGKGLPALFWGARVNRLSDATLLSVLGALPDIRQQGYPLTEGTYTLGGSMPLEYDIVTAP